VRVLKTAGIVCAVLILFVIGSERVAFATPGGWFYEQHAIYVNGQRFDVWGYRNVDWKEFGEYRLRDIAYILDGTSAQFNIREPLDGHLHFWIERNVPYLPIGKELTYFYEDDEDESGFLRRLGQFHAYAVVHNPVQQVILSVDGVDTPTANIVVTVLTSFGFPQGELERLADLDQVYFDISDFAGILGFNLDFKDGELHIETGDLTDVPESQPLELLDALLRLTGHWVDRRFYDSDVISKEAAWPHEFEIGLHGLRYNSGFLSYNFSGIPLTARQPVTWDRDRIFFPLILESLEDGVMTISAYGPERKIKVDLNTFPITNFFYYVDGVPFEMVRLDIHRNPSLMIDEYQDTNYIQEQIVFLLGGEKKNICVVGDDDQGLYRFRGATIRNILEFPSKFGECTVIPLVVNYRSNSDIVDFYNNWMSTTDGAKFKFRWGEFRYRKTIEPHAKSTLKSPAAVKLSSVNDEEEWHKKILDFICEAKNAGKLTDYNQIAFLFNSVKNERALKLARFLEANGVNVYSPRSDMFFERDEVQLLLGCLMLMFPQYVSDLEAKRFDHLADEHYAYYKNCIQRATETINKNQELLKFFRRLGKRHFGLKETTDYGYSGLIYQLFEYAPFSKFLDTNLAGGIIDVRATRNLAQLTQIVGKFEYLHNISVLDGRENKGRRIEKDTELLFNLYIRLLRDEGINEYEDDSEYAPSGCVSFLTIHQSKGMEFPIVFVDSLSNTPRKSYNIAFSKTIRNSLSF